MIFKIEKKLKNSLGRAGVLITAHGEIHTPAFVPVATKASVKALTPEQVSDLGAEVVLGNTYHLYLQPGDEIVAKAGGLGKFMGWPGPTMTDSGGFQVFSLGAAYGKDTRLNGAVGQVSKVMKLANIPLIIPERFDDALAPRLAKIGQDGVSFKSHLDGSIHYITPEKSIQIQHNLGADIIFAFDECTSPSEDLRYQEEALERTHAWAKRSLKEHQKLINSPLEEYPKGEVDEFSTPPRKRATPQEGNKPALFGIVQGGRDKELRKKSAEFLKNLDFDGYGIGGSFAKEDMSSAVKWVNEILPEDKPRHLLGIGEPEDLFMGIENGVDLFDCVAPTRLGRNGTIYTREGRIIIMNKEFRDDFRPIEDDCECYVCNHPSRDLPFTGEEGPVPLRRGTSGGGYSRAYIAHLFHGKEMLGGTLASIHNLYFIVNLVKKIRQSILDDSFFEFKKAFLKGYVHK